MSYSVMFRFELCDEYMRKGLEIQHYYQKTYHSISLSFVVGSFFSYFIKKVNNNILDKKSHSFQNIQQLIATNFNFSIIR